MEETTPATEQEIPVAEEKVEEASNEKESKGDTE